MRIMVAHPFQQHSFKTAIALKESNSLFKYATTVYFKRGTLTFLLSKLLKGDNLKRLLGRRTEKLDDDDVVVLSEWTNLILLLLQRVDNKKSIYNYWYKKTIKKFNTHLFNCTKSHLWYSFVQWV